MTLKEHLPTLAILVSLAGLSIALWTATFNRRLKAAELRISLLSKVTELIVRGEKLHIAQRNLRDIGHERNVATLIEGLAAIDAEAAGIRSIAEAIYEDLSNKPNRAVFSYYESNFHKLHKASEAMQSLESRATALEATVERDFPSAAKG